MEHRPGRRRGIAAIVLLVLGAVVLAGVTVAKAVAPPAHFTQGKQVGWAMAPTYTDGEGIYLEPAGTLRRGDIVLAKVPWSLAKTQMNRVIAVGGDRIQYRVSSKLAGQYLLLNGKPLDEPYLEEWKHPSTVPFDVRVPEGQVFLMADDRLNSDGSQFANNGPVPATDVVAKVVTYPMAKLAVWVQVLGGLLLLAGAVLGGVARRARKRAPAEAAAPAAVPAAVAAEAQRQDGGVRGAEAGEPAEAAPAAQGPTVPGGRKEAQP